MDLRKRIQRLEQHAPEVSGPVVILRKFVVPSLKGPVSTGVRLARVGSKTLRREADETEGAFLARVDEAADQIPLQPQPRKERPKG